jgi:putative ABC transport system ATP-binding protein
MNAPPANPLCAHNGTTGRVLVRTVALHKVYRKGGYETVALGGIDLVIYSGEFIAIMGPSGSGKSTFFNMVGALDTPTSGRILIDEVDVAQLTAVELAFVRSRKIGYIFQQYNLIPYLTALENVTTALHFAGIPADEARGRGMEVLRLVGLGDRWSHRPLEMSGGQQQRVAIARAMANRPGILLCDEPTANLDFGTGAEIMTLLHALNRERGVTIICATHDHRMLKLCDRLVWIRDGLIERVATSDEVVIEEGFMKGEPVSHGG